MDGHDDHLATMAEADAEYATNAGASRPDVAWILSDRDVWYPNPAYKGPAVPHPDDEIEPDDTDWDNVPDVAWVGSVLFHRVKKGEPISTDFNGGVYIDGKCAIFTDPAGKPKAALINNESTLRTGPFFVSCSARPDGRLRYMHAACTSDKAFLGIAGLGYAATNELALKVSRNLGLHPPVPKPAVDDPLDSDIDF